MMLEVFTCSLKLTQCFQKSQLILKPNPHKQIMETESGISSNLKKQTEIKDMLNISTRDIVNKVVTIMCWLVADG